MDKKLYEEFKEILRSELVPALGCTEPGAIACAAAEAGIIPTHMHSVRRSAKNRILFLFFICFPLLS